MALWNKKERKIKKFINKYQKMYKSLLKAHNELIDCDIELIDTINNYQIQSFIKDIEIVCVMIDRLMTEESKSFPELFQTFFNSIPKYSSFENEKNSFTNESYIYFIPENIYDVTKRDEHHQQIESLEKFKKSFYKKIKYGCFVTQKPFNKNDYELNYENQDQLNFLNNLNKLKTLALYDLKSIQEIQDYFYNFFYNTQKMLYSNLVFQELPSDISKENLELHTVTQLFIENGVINKESPFKTPVCNIPKVIKPYTGNFNLFNVALQK